MHIEKLVHMANDIGAFFQAEPDHALAVHGVVDHIRKFWDPRMRRQIIAFSREGGAGMSELVKAAVKALDQQSANVATGG